MPGPYKTAMICGEFYPNPDAGISASVSRINVFFGLFIMGLAVEIISLYH